MAELAKANNIKVVLCSVLPVYEYSPDGVHLNLEGYKIMDELVEKAISRALKIK
jgi:lysophospholipase L1-like esterase